MEKKHLIRDLVTELSSNNLAIFAGAGLSVAAGFVDWKDLLRNLAEDIGLDVDKEYDLITLAQYYVNEKNSRNKINQTILDEFSRRAQLTENHKILARLPIDTYWTTNYDSMIEDALKQEGKIVDVKYTNDHLPVSLHKKDATVYKMHGDYQHPNSTTLIKDDYEKYHLNKNDFFVALRGQSGHSGPAAD